MEPLICYYICKRKTHCKIIQPDGQGGTYYGKNLHRKRKQKIKSLYHRYRGGGRGASYNNRKLLPDFRTDRSHRHHNHLR